MTAKVRRYLPEPSDVTIGTIRVVVDKAGLIDLTRLDRTITLVPSEAVAIAEYLLEQFGAQQVDEPVAVPPTVAGYAIGTRHQGPVAAQRPGRGAS